MARDARLAQDVAERQRAMFAMFVGRGLYATRAALAAASGIPESSLRGYADGAAMPFHAVLALGPCLPREALNMLAEPGGLRLVDVEQAASDWDASAAAAAGFVAEVCEARRDGHIDHVETARLQRRARELNALLSDVAER